MFGANTQFVIIFNFTLKIFKLTIVINKFKSLFKLTLLIQIDVFIFNQLETDLIFTFFKPNLRLIINYSF
jgi:hypothetical protein